MKKQLYTIALAVLTVIASSCQEDFLEEQPNQQLSLEQLREAAKTDPSLLTAFVDGIYSTMYQSGTGGTTNHDDFGQKGYDIYADMLSSDMVLAGTTYGWYSNIARYQATKDFTVNAAYQPWRYYYRIIFGANSLIELLGGNDATQTDAGRTHLMGQAKALRAYAYFYLTQFYSTGYGNGSEKILPIYNTTTVPAQPKSTAAEVYEFMVKDLDAAIVALQGFNRTAKLQVDQTVAKGLLSYVLAARGTQADLQRVVTLTNEIVATTPYRILNPNEVVAQFDAAGQITNRTTAGFNNVASPSWIWGVDLLPAYGLNLISWWGQVDVFTYSYAWAGDPKSIDKSLYDAIRTGDIRKGQFISTNLQPRNKFFAPNRVIGQQRQVETDYVYMRLEEFVLLNAEAKAKLGQESLAKDALKTLLSKRMTTAADYLYVDALSGQALLNEIHLQTRIELWGEGKSYLSLKRNKRTVTRGTNHLFEAGNSFAWNSDELTFEIPQAEILNNPVLSE
ncbi:RagB/SusD family nutrient uptake outer membrane protein [Rufibacter tibetensis]|uniref:Glycan metabolism protein RagB n=1 Tax=Rufibacter tibetensis TaxID=512763 RepID=A0A0N7HWJ5_9BACT|nr:RagB/SusD family nutrient uptake outer membrane protein [Rufibacter tibetensis]ALI99424.1 glycan metabolism protein RagB [Rufibacter tibetensis]